jgi:hypothetical protein
VPVPGTLAVLADVFVDSLSVCKQMLGDLDEALNAMKS